MTYSLEFDQRALKEWQKLGDTTAFFKVGEPTEFGRNRTLRFSDLS